MMAPETMEKQSNQKTSVGVTVETKSERVGIEDHIQCNSGYFRTLRGILNIVQLILTIICMICASPVVAPYTRFFMFVIAVSFISVIAIALVNGFAAATTFPSFPWLLLEMSWLAIMTVLMFVAMVVQLAMTSRVDYYHALSHYNYYSAYIAAGAISVFCLVDYIIWTLLVFKDCRDTRPCGISTWPYSDIFPPPTTANNTTSSPTVRA